MLFNSLAFALFLPLTFYGYWALRGFRLNVQNLYLLLISYLFYGWWDWRFLLLIMTSSLTDYLIGQRMPDASNKMRKLLLGLSLGINLGLLGFFKYFNFFIDSFVSLSETLGFQANINSLNIILPVGISFYTFQTLSYTIDIYRGKIQPVQNPITFFAFVSFFPQLVAGPIERAKNLLPQLNTERQFNYDEALLGLRQILWGLFKKMVIADNCAPYVDTIFANPEAMPTGTLLIGVILFAFQIYGDFSGYSDIAIGTARLFGIKLMQNFRYPYFASDVGEFWRRWHISLSTWFRDYVYIPLGGSKYGRLKTARNILIVFSVSGLWHGANWTFVAWGVLNALYLLPLALRTDKFVGPNQNSTLKQAVMTFGSTLLTFSLICLAWVFFRSENIASALAYVYRLLFDFSLTIHSPFLLIPLLLVACCVTIEWIYRDQSFPLARPPGNTVIRWGLYSCLFLAICANTENTDTFIYFQF